MQTSFLEGIADLKNRRQLHKIQQDQGEVVRWKCRRQRRCSRSETMPRWWTLSVVDDLDVGDDERVIPRCGDEAHEHVEKDGGK